MSWDILKTYSEIRSFAGDAFNSSFLDKRTFKCPQDVLLVIMAGRDLGVGPGTALREFHSIHGKWEISAALMLALAIKQGVEVEWLETTNEKAVLKLTRNGTSHTHRFTMQDAQVAGITKNPTYRSYPGAMLRARCMSAAVHAFCPDALAGGAVYVHGEVSGHNEREAEMCSNEPTEAIGLEEVMLQRNGKLLTDDAGEAACEADLETKIHWKERIESADSILALDQLKPDIASLTLPQKEALKPIFVAKRHELEREIGEIR
tara:strand:- start:269 stop:1054 length:786 start_codon:yes stop_codon:yes gene_type:complete